MHLSLAETEDLPPSGSTTLSLGPQAVSLRIDLDDAEILEGIDLRLVRAAEVATQPTPCLLYTSPTPCTRPWWNICLRTRSSSTC